MKNEEFLDPYKDMSDEERLRLCVLQVVGFLAAMGVVGVFQIICSFLW